jgi:hypothetical protein
LNQQPYSVDDPNGVINRLFAEASQVAWDSFREMMWKLAEDPFPATSPHPNITVGQGLMGDPPDFIAPFDDGRGLLIYYVDAPIIILEDFVLAE